MTDRPITPTRIIPAGAPLPPAGDPPTWWNTPPPPAPPPPRPPAPPHPAGPGPLDIHVHSTFEVIFPSTEPEPTPSWWQRLHIRWTYNAGCLVVALPLSQPWRSVLAHVRDDQSLLGAWTFAVIPLAVLGILDNARRVEAAHAAPDLWGPKIRAALTRIALWAVVIATATALPIATTAYLLTGVRT